MRSGELLGVVFGVLLNGLLPAVVIVTILVLILSYNSYKTFKKGFAARAKETRAMQKSVSKGSKHIRPLGHEEGLQAAASAPPSPPPRQRRKSQLSLRRRLDVKVLTERDTRSGRWGVS